MKAYMNAPIYAVSEDKLAYKVSGIEIYDNQNYISVELELVAGWDYVDPDTSDIQGWCPAERFVEDVQYDFVIQYFVEESMTEALEANGYTVLKNYKDYTK